MTGFVAYQGPSRLDGGPVVVIVTLGSANDKTGDMNQAWVLRADVAPGTAIETGRDRSICGDCAHRSGGRLGRSCYVVTWLGPTNVWKAYTAGKYPSVLPHEAAAYVAGEMLRLTAYGDMGAVPYFVWWNLLRGTTGHTAYTHQWRTCDQRLAEFAMASVESEHEVDEANRLGWRTFRTRTPQEPIRSDEIVCPASAEADHGKTCAACLLCTGLRRPTARNIAIIAHGARAANFLTLKEAVLS